MHTLVLSPAFSQDFLTMLNLWEKIRVFAEIHRRGNNLTLDFRCFNWRSLSSTFWANAIALINVQLSRSNPWFSLFSSRIKHVNHPYVCSHATATTSCRRGDIWTRPQRWALLSYSHYNVFVACTGGTWPLIMLSNFWCPLQDAVQNAMVAMGCCVVYWSSP